MTNVTCGLTAKKLGSAACPTLVIEYWTTTTLVGEASARLIACTSAEACQFGPSALFLQGKPVCLLIGSLIRDHFMNVTV